MKWGVAAIAKVCEPTEQRDPRQNPAGEFHYVDIAGIDRTLKAIVEHQTLMGIDAPSRARKVIRKDDVLVSTVRPNLNAVAVVPACLDGEIASTGFCVLRPNRDCVEPRYLFYWTITSTFVDALTSRVRGANYPAVSDHDVKEVTIPLPPPAEQRRIVEILDQANHLRKLRDEADAKSNRILPALLVRALGSPANWRSGPCCRPLGDFVDPVSGATPSKATERFWSGEVPWVSPKDMKTDFLSDSQDHVSQAAVDETNLNVIEQGSTLIVVRGMILARDVPVAINRNPVTINQDMKALVPKTKEITGAYIWATLHLARRKLQMLVRTAGHGTRKLDTPDLMQFPIPSPDPDRLKQVASLVEHHRLAVEQRLKSERMLDHVFALTLNKAFDGSLTAS
ncbi:MAG: restriction endonuclease subunit S [Chloroflexota bacterium]|nr:restriction endonuclease subunit S [Chloroflexota bacterium]